MNKEPELMKKNVRKSSCYVIQFFRAFGLAVGLTLLIALSACDDSTIAGIPEYDTDDGLSLVWEAWGIINDTYVSADGLDAETAVLGGMSTVLTLLDVPPYPFLADVGRMRGQPPGHVPVELTDLWRAVSIYRSSNPDFDPSSVAEAAVAGLVEGLGDSSAVFLDATQYPIAKKSLEGRMDGSYQGIGCRVVSRDGEIVLFPFAGSPAERAGVLPGDALFAVGGVSVAGLDVEEVVDRVSGSKGTKVELEIIRTGDPEPIVLEVFRGNIELRSVASQLMPGGIGYLRISHFRDNTGEQVFSALETFKRFDLLGLVLDIRTNPGGSLEAAKITAGQFLPEGTVFGYKEDGDGNWTKLTIDSDEDQLDLDGLLIAVLVNGQTAREAETVAAALQDAGRATLFGTNTFGNASTYAFLELSNGSAIYLPISRGYTPFGKLIERTGLIPDVVVLSVSETGEFGGESQLNRAYDFLNGRLPPFR